MRQYYYTDKLLFGLAITNLWMLIPAFWETRWEWSLFQAVPGGHGSILTSISLSTAYWLLILGLTTFAFFKRWRWVVIFYVLYLSRTMPITIYSLLESWKDHESLNFLFLRLFSYSKAFLWLLALLTLIIMVIETDFKNLSNRWHKRLIRS